MYRGTVGGRHRASSRPVSTALPSRIVFSLPVIRLKTHSVSTAETMLMRTISRACTPKCHTPNTVAGSRARITSYMTPPVVSGLRTWGLEET